MCAYVRQCVCVYVRLCVTVCVCVTAIQPVPREARNSMVDRTNEEEMHQSASLHSRQRVVCVFVCVCV